MATANIIYSATAGYNGAWGSYSNSSAYAGNNSTNNYVASIRFQTPAFLGNPSQVTLSIPIIRGYTNNSATLYVSLSTSDPTASNIYTGNTPGSDSAQLYTSPITFKELSNSVQFATIAIPTSAILPSSTYYLILSADRPAANVNNFIQVYSPSVSTVTGYVSFIERASTISANVNSQEMGKNVVFSIARENAAYTHRLAYRYNGTGTFTEFAHNVGIAYTYAFPISLASSIPTEDSGVWQIRCQTYSGEILIGETTTNVTLTVPSSIRPTINNFTYSVVSENQTVRSWGIFVQGYSSINILLEAVANYSIIRSWSVTYADGAYGEENVGQSISINQTTSPVLATGEHEIIFTVEDARGRSVSQRQTYTVESYSPPIAAYSSVYRSTANGVASDAGKYIAVAVTSAFSSCGGHNKLKRLSVAYKNREDSAYSAEVPLANGERLIIGDGQISVIRSYNVRISLEDQLNSITVNAIIATQRATINAKRNGNAVAFGKYAENENSLELAEGWTLILNNSNGESSELSRDSLSLLLKLVNSGVDVLNELKALKDKANKSFVLLGTTTGLETISLPAECNEFVVEWIDPRYIKRYTQSAYVLRDQLDSSYKSFALAETVSEDGALSCLVSSTKACLDIDAAPSNVTFRMNVYGR